MRRVRTLSLSLLSLLVPVALLGSGCKGREEELSKKLNETGDRLVECRKETNDLKNQVSGLKRQLAQALANPGRIQLTDPEVINLIADIKGVPAGDPNLLAKGSLDPKVASKIVYEGAQAIRQCYERALKKNQALQMQAGKEIMLEVTVQPQGSVGAVDMKPSPDNDMTSCVRAAATRWKFPAFQGEAVVLQQKVRLTPKT